MATEDGKVDASRWYAAIQRWMDEFWRPQPDAPQQPPGADAASR
jgi:hypothetical protein